MLSVCYNEKSDKFKKSSKSELNSNELALLHTHKVELYKMYEDIVIAQYELKVLKRY